MTRLSDLIHTDYLIVFVRNNTIYIIGKNNMLHRNTFWLKTQQQHKQIKAPKLIKSMPVRST